MSGTVAELVAEFLVSKGVRRIFGLCGGHIQPMWDAAARAGIEIVDVRHEGAAVLMAHAAAEVTDTVGIAMVTAGPGVTNATTGIANASVSGVPLLVLAGRTPRAQTGMGAMQDVPQAELLRPLCRATHQLWDQRHVVAELNAAFTSALGVHGRPGPVYIDLPVDLQDEVVAERNAILPVRSHPHPRPPARGALDEAAELIADGKRILVIAGRSGRTAREVLPSFLERVDAVFLDSGETRGLVGVDNPRYVPAVRGKAIAQADLVITLGRRLDFQLAYGSAAVFDNTARFLRIGQGFAETGENRPGDVEVHADVNEALTALVERDVSPKAPDLSWVTGLQGENRSRVSRLADTVATAPPGQDGRMHPFRLIEALNSTVIDDDTVVVADGGDILSFARVALKAPTYLDCGPLGCLGVGVPFAIGACASQPGRRSVALIGDGSFGFHLAEIDSAVRRNAQALFVVANNEAWNIERHDQNERYAGNLVGVDLPGCRYDVVAEGLGAHGELVEREEDLAAALARASENLPAVVNVLVTRDAVSPDFRSGLAAVPQFQALATWDAAEQAVRQLPESSTAPR